RMWLWLGVDFAHQGSWVVFVKIFGKWAVQNTLGFLIDPAMNRFDRIVGAAPRAKAIAVRFKSRFPFRFQRRFDQSLTRPVAYHGDAQWTQLRRVRLWYPDPSHWPRLIV